MERENSPPGRTPGKGKIYAAAQLTLGMEPTKWILGRRAEEPVPSYGRLAVDLSVKLGGAPRVTRKTWHGLYGSMDPWPERVTHETIRRWHDLAITEEAEQGASAIPPAVFRDGGV